MLSQTSKRSSAVPADEKLRARLRIIETTDLHMQILPYDYFADRDEKRTGLIQLAGKIDALRGEAGITTLLFDNGDFLQGNPLADYLVAHPEIATVHPMIAAFNTLGYDAVTLGNHEFNYGLPFLRKTLKDAAFPITCANLRQLQGPPLAQPYVILDRTVTRSDGKTHPLRIGVVGFVTPQIVDWDCAALRGQLETDDIVASARAMVPRIKAAGADIIVALCHSGIGAADHSPRMENAAVPLAAVPDIDVILTGHTHEVFPGGTHSAKAGVDPVAGTLHGKPAVMAGFYGNALGVIDLELEMHADGVRIAKASSELVEGTTESRCSDNLRQVVQAAHTATLAYIRKPIARTNISLHSYFSSFQADMLQQLLADAQANEVRKALADTPHHDLPVLSATAPFRFGGRAGPGHFTEIPPGPILLRDAAAIYPFANVLCAVRRTGAQLRRWLEWSAAHFNQIIPGVHDQPLINPQIPAYNYDTIFGLDYTFDLTRPPCAKGEGTATGGRLRDLRHQGRQVADTDIFIVAANGYRTNGGGGFAGIPADDVLYRTKLTTHDILINDLTTRATIDAVPAPPYRFAPVPGTSAIFRSAPRARNHLTDDMEHLGPDKDGFDLYRIFL